MTAADTHRTIDAVYRLESAKLIARLARMVRDVGLAEELAQDALVAALEQWPESGVPDNPGAWLMATAKHRAINVLRRGKLLERKHEELGHELEARQEMAVPNLEDVVDDDVGDDLLRLVFTACHPVLSIEARVALTLRLLGGLTTDEIARAFLVSEPTIAQRIVRAKRTLADEHVPFEVPRGDELAQRLSSVLGVIYLVFNEGYAATSGDDLMRPQLCEDALRLGRILAQLAPAEPEVHGLVALMEIQASRAAARTGADRRARAPPRSEPRALGSAPHSSRARGARARRGARRRERPLRAPGRDRGLPRPGEHRSGDGLGAHRVALRSARADHAVARRGAESSDGGRDGVRSRRGPRDRGCADERALARSATTSCRARAATSSRSSDATRRHARSSSARPRSRATRASAPCSSSAPPPAPASRRRPDRSRARQTAPIDRPTLTFLPTPRR